MGLYSGGLVIGRIFTSEIRGAYSVLGGLIFWAGAGGGLLSEFYGTSSKFDCINGPLDRHDSLSVKAMVNSLLLSV